MMQAVTPSLENSRSALSMTAISLLLGAVACSGDDDEEKVSGSQTATLEMALQGLEPLAAGYEYEGWFVGEDGPVSAGRFNVSGDTAQVEIPVSALDGAMTYVLTIEPPLGEDDPAPSDTHVLAGAWDGRSATLSIDHEAALGDDFGAASGVFILETPTSEASDDFSQGIWFLDPSQGPGPGLSLPELPQGWVYEGWVAGPDGPVSTGTFVDPAGVDSDAGGPAAGPSDAPPYPGQDFIDPSRDLVAQEYVAVISVEPFPDDSSAPFAFKPLVGTIAAEEAGVTQELGNESAGAPSGTVTLL